MLAAQLRIGLVETSINNTAATLCKLASIQGLCSLLIGVLVYISFDAYQAISALFGGITAALANFYLSVKTRVSSKKVISNIILDEEERATQLLQQFYRFELGKIVFTIAMLMIFIVVLKASVLAFLIAYLIVALIVNWVSLLILDHSSESQSE